MSMWGGLDHKCSVLRDGNPRHQCTFARGNFVLVNTMSGEVDSW